MKKHFVTGLIFLLPAAVTLAIVVFIVNLLTNPFLGVVNSLFDKFDISSPDILFLSGKEILLYGSRVLILISLFLFTIMLGVLTRWFFIHYLISMGDYIIHRIPIINKLYKTSQDIIHTIFSSQTNSFKQVVLAPFPSEKSFTLGFITREAPPSCKEKTGASSLTSVFVPTTPNPTSGYLLMFPEEDLHYLDMKVEDAIKFVISVGVIYPGAPEGVKIIEKGNNGTDAKKS